MARTNIVLSKSAILLEYQKTVKNRSNARLSVAVQKAKFMWVTNRFFFYLSKAVTTRSKK